jgi:hypothetical protein
MRVNKDGKEYYVLVLLLLFVLATNENAGYV